MTSRTQRTVPRPFYCSRNSDNDANADGRIGDYPIGTILYYPNASNPGELLSTTDLSLAQSEGGPDPGASGRFGSPHNWYFYSIGEQRIDNMTWRNVPIPLEITQSELFTSVRWEWESTDGQ